MQKPLRNETIRMYTQYMGSDVDRRLSNLEKKWSLTKASLASSVGKMDPNINTLCVLRPLEENPIYSCRESNNLSNGWISFS